jgi:hypothetical protein
MMSDQTKQPGMKRTCARLPGRLKTNIYATSFLAALVADVTGLVLT